MMILLAAVLSSLVNWHYLSILNVIVIVVCLSKLYLVETSLSSSSLSSSSRMKRVLVTGGNKSVGMSICRRLLEEQHNVFVILVVRDVGRGEESVWSLSPILQDRIKLDHILPPTDGLRK